MTILGTNNFFSKKTARYVTYQLPVSIICVRNGNRILYWFIFVFTLLTSEVHFIMDCTITLASFFCYLTDVYEYKKKGRNVEFEFMLVTIIFGFQYDFRDIWPENITSSLLGKTEKLVYVLWEYYLLCMDPSHIILRHCYVTPWLSLWENDTRI